MPLVSDGMGLKETVNKIVAIVKDLPTKLGIVGTRMRDFVKEVFEMTGDTIVEKIKSIVKEIRDYIEGTRNDILKFYNVGTAYIFPYN